MLWMRMPAESWWAAGAMFMQMWAVMTVLMMAPLIAFSLWSDRRPGNPVRSRWDWAGAAAGYFLVWILSGVPVFAIGAALMSAAMQIESLQRWGPLLTGALLIGGALYQLSPVKTRRLQHCCMGRAAWAGASSWEYGIRLGIECVLCCAGLTAMMLALGSMDGRLMALFGAAMLAERGARRSSQWARAIGIVALVSAGIRIVALAALIV